MMIGRKDDEQKPRTDLLPPKAILEIARVLAHGAGKYSDNGWREVPDATRRYTAAALRHVLAFMAGDTIDTESGLHHLSHAVCSLMFVIELDGDAKDFLTYAKPEPRTARKQTSKRQTIRLDKAMFDRLAFGMDKPADEVIGVLMTDDGEIEIRRA